MTAAAGGPAGASGACRRRRPGHATEGRRSAGPGVILHRLEPTGAAYSRDRRLRRGGTGPDEAFTVFWFARRHRSPCLRPCPDGSLRGSAPLKCAGEVARPAQAEGVGGAMRRGRGVRGRTVRDFGATTSKTPSAPGKKAERFGFAGMVPPFHSCWLTFFREAWCSPPSAPTPADQRPDAAQQQRPGRAAGDRGRSRR